MGNYAVLLLLVSLLLPAQARAEEEIKYAPAIIFRSVEWWRPSRSGEMVWFAGADRSNFPANLGQIKEARLVGRQEIDWLGRTFEIEKVVRTDAGNIIVTFDKWKLDMGKTHEDRWLVDVFPPDDRFVTARFRTSTKATAHLDGK